MDAPATLYPDKVSIVFRADAKTENVIRFCDTTQDLILVLFSLVVNEGENVLDYF